MHEGIRGGSGADRGRVGCIDDGHGMRPGAENGSGEAEAGAPERGARRRLRLGSHLAGGAVDIPVIETT